MVLNNNSKIKLFKDWKSYSERIEKEKDDELFWNKKNLRSITGLGNIFNLFYFIA